MIYHIIKSSCRILCGLKRCIPNCWRKKWQPTPVFLPSESCGRRSPVGGCLWGRTGSDTTEATQQEQQQTKLFTRSGQLSRVQLCNPANRSTPGLPVHHRLSEFTQTHVHWMGDAIQPSHPLTSPSPPAFNVSQHQGLFKWVTSSHEVAKVLELQPQHQSLQWTPRTDLL